MVTSVEQDGLSVVMSPCTFFDEEGYLFTEECVYRLIAFLHSEAISDSVRFKYPNAERNATSFSRGSTYRPTCCSIICFLCNALYINCCLFVSFL